jgi:hypothetical protein
VKRLLVREIPVSFDGKKWHHKMESFEVTVMCVSGAYAMVRRPRCYPFVAPLKQLKEIA